MHRPRLLNLTLALLLPITTLADELTPDEATVWQREESYWRYAKASDRAAFLALWSERFVGWPIFALHPLGKASLEDGIDLLHENPERVYDYRLKREAVRSFGDIVVTHYVYWDIWRDAESGAVVEERGPFRITHTWQRHGDTWQIVTGMSASFD
jgi:hypothetical protein